jgi:hypothetical protein
MKEISMLSDGTVVAMADLENSHTQTFIRIGADLAGYLQEELPNIFDSSFQRKFDTVWCTLGYFDHDDFEITENIRDSFNIIIRNIITVNIKELQMVQFKKEHLMTLNLSGSLFLCDHGLISNIKNKHLSVIILMCRNTDKSKEMSKLLVPTYSVIIITIG